MIAGLRDRMPVLLFMKRFEAVVTGLLADMKAIIALCHKLTSSIHIRVVLHTLVQAINKFNGEGHKVEYLSLQSLGAIKATKIPEENTDLLRKIMKVRARTRLHAW